MSDLSLRVRPSADASGGGSHAVPDVGWELVERWESLDGWLQLSDLAPTEYAPVGIVEPGWLGIADATLTAGYPASAPGIGGVIRQFPLDWLVSGGGVRAQMIVSGVHPIEATPLVAFGAELPNVSAPNVLGAGAWLGHDFEFLGNHLGPILLGGGLAYPPDDFASYLFDSHLYPHVSGVQFFTEVRVYPDGTVIAGINGQDLVDFPLDAGAADTLWVGATVDAHFATPNYPPYNISPVPSVSTRAAGTLRVGRIAP